MNKKLLIVMILVAATVQLYAQDPSPATNCPQVTSVVVDGNADEWGMDWKKDPNEKMSYNICFDDNNLYVRMKTNDETVKRKIGFFGFTLWMDPRGKKKRKLGLRFPTGAESKEKLNALKDTGERQSRMSSSERSDFHKEVSKSLIADVELIELLGLTDEPLTSSRSGITNGIKVAIGMNGDGEYVYEAIVPFKSFRLSKSILPVLGVGFETGKYVLPKQPSSNSGTQGVGGYGVGGSGAGGGYGGRGGMGGRGMGGGGGGGYSAPRQSNPMGESTSQWVTIKLN